MAAIKVRSATPILPFLNAMVYCNQQFCGHIAAQLTRMRTETNVWPARDLKVLASPPLPNSAERREFEKRSEACLLNESNLTIVVMAYNEGFILQHTLPQFVESADQVVIVDMGSDDDSLDLYTKHLRAQDIVVNYPRRALFTFGFSHPRNYGAMFAEGKWVFAVDADEWIDPQEVSAARSELVKPNSPFVFSVARRNYKNNGTSSLDDLSNLFVSAPFDGETHRRLSQPSATVRWEGLIHEEIWWDGDSAYKRCGHVNITLHHLNHYKPSGSEEAKGGLYCFLTLRAVQFPKFRLGTNPFWVTDYVKENFSNLLSQANDFAAKYGLSPLDEAELRIRVYAAE